MNTYYSEMLNNLKADKVYSMVDAWAPEMGFNVDVDNLEPGQVIETAVFREGKFKHPWYGMLDFTEQYLNDMVNNFNRGIVTKIAANIDHMPRHGAFGWVEEKAGALFTRKLTVKTPLGPKQLTFLFVRWTPTEEAVEMIKKKKYRFFSAEISDKFTTREVHETTDDEGNLVEAQYTVKGPVFTGFALTNIPFISELPGMFSTGVMNRPNGEDEIEFTIVKDTYKEYQTEGMQLFSMSFSDIVREDNAETPENEDDLIFNDSSHNVSSDVSGTTATPTERTNMDFTMIFSKLGELDGAQERVTYLNDQLAEASENDKVALNALIASARREADAELALSKVTQQKLAAEAEAKELSQRNQSLLIEAAEARELSWRDKVSVFSRELTDAKIHKPVVDRVEEVLLSMDASARKFSLTLNEGEGALDLMKIFSHILAALPEDARLDESNNFSGAPQTGAGEEAPTPANTPEPVVEVVPPMNADPVQKNETQFSDEEEARIKEFCDMTGMSRGDLEGNEALFNEVRTGDLYNING